MLNPIKPFMNVPPKENPIDINPEYQRHLNLLILLEGYKTKIKNLHWAASGFNIHKRLDDLLDIVSDYQDTVAESSMGIWGQVDSTFLQPTVPVSLKDPIEMLEALTNDILNFYAKYSEEKIIAGLKSEQETFIVNLQQQMYLFKLCKG